jgi:serine/threonine protein kinase/Tfp pilus assembly protein PilF
MMAHNEIPGGAESIDQRYFARRANAVDDDESVARPGLTPAFAPRESEAPSEPRSFAAPWEGEAPSEPQSFAALRSQKRALLAEQRAGWNEGRPAPPEDLLRRWPTDPAADPDAASLLAADYFQRRRRGEGPSLNEYEDRFPAQSRSLASLVSLHDALRSLNDTAPDQDQVPTLRLPDVGDAVFGFRLEHALGKGAFARVFLARQGHLAGRPVVLKVSAIEGTEPQTLAQLQHTNIVPIYSVHEDTEAGLRAVCMPYFGGASLSRVLEELFSASPVPQHGPEFVKALGAVQAPALDRVQDQDGTVIAHPGQTPLDALAGLDYARVTIWVASRLAEGLQHAHQRGVLHRDVKPSNVLISAEGQPLLLDFNLAHDRSTDLAHASIGGTIAYMAPEHLRAILQPTPEQVRLVDHRSDIYSLGMGIAEMLTGQNPFAQSASYSAFPLQIEAMVLERSKQVSSVRATRAEVPWGLESVVRKCLDPDPAQRYQQADQLAEDLRRLLDDRPLRYPSELSQVERCRKWARRHPRLTTAGTVATVAAVALVTLATAFAGVSRHLSRTRDDLGILQARNRLAAHDAGTDEALTLVNTVIERQDLLRQGLAVCQRTLALYDPPAGSDRKEHPDWVRLNPDQRRRVAEDRRELLLLAAGARVLLAPGDRRASRAALAELGKAEAIPGLEPSRALWNDRARYLALLGDGERARVARRRAAATPAYTARDHYLLATSYARQGGSGGYDRAISELNQTLRIKPGHYWSHLLRGVCFLEKGDDVAASGDFGACAGLRGDLAWGYFNRAYVLDRSGKKAQAVEDYTAAIGRDPRFVPARINRGMALLQLRRYREALEDFEAVRAGNPRAEDAALSAGRGMALEGLGQHEQADAVFARAFTAVGSAPCAARTRLLWTYGFAVSARLPAQARAAFQEVLEGDARHPQALYGLAMLAMSDGRNQETIALLNRAVQAAPDFVEARRYRAVALARCSAWEQASRDIRWCLDREPTVGETLYAAACVSSLAAGKLGTKETLQQSISLLRQALERGVGRDKLGTDPDLESLRGRPEFERLAHRADDNPAPPNTP